MRKSLSVAGFVLFTAMVNPARAQFCPGANGWVFDDVPASDMFCSYITWAARNGITQGCLIIDGSHRLYCPNDAASRSQMSAFVTRMASNSVFAQGGNAFGVNATLGTLDMFPLEIHANGNRVMRYDGTTPGPNILGGFHGNSADSGYYAMTIAGGGTTEVNCFDADTGLARQCSNRAKGAGTTIGGGSGNRALGTYSTIAGGLSNQTGSTLTVSGYTATIGGGNQNTARGLFSTIGGGFGNTTLGSGDQTIAGGSSNVAEGQGSAIPGGYDNRTLGAYAFAAGMHAKAMQSGCFVWSDTSGTETVCNSENAFVARASGGFTLATNTDMTTGCSIAPGGGAWSCTSSRDTKTSFAALDPAEILLKVAALPISTWIYVTDTTGSKHLGPTAEDFRDAFGLGESSKHIGLLDVGGVALAAVQGLNAKLEARITEQSREIETQRNEIEELKRAVQEMMAGRTR
jgi:hypothetical protein